MLASLTNWEMIKGGGWISFHRMPHKVIRPFKRETLNNLKNYEVIHSPALWGVKIWQKSCCGQSYGQYRSLLSWINQSRYWNVNTNVLKQSLIRLGKVFELHLVISQNSALPQKDKNGWSPWALLSFDALFDTLTFTSAFCFKIWLLLCSTTLKALLQTFSKQSTSLIGAFRENFL